MHPRISPRIPPCVRVFCIHFFVIRCLGNRTLYDIPPPTHWALTNIQTISHPLHSPPSPPLFFFFCKSSKVLLHAIRFAAIMRTACVSWFQLTAQRPPSTKGGTTPTPCQALFPYRLVPSAPFWRRRKMVTECRLAILLCARTTALKLHSDECPKQKRLPACSHHPHNGVHTTFFCCARFSFHVEKTHFSNHGWHVRIPI